jgi:hypothetical protein
MPLKAYNGLPVYPAYFGEAMDRLRDKFLSIPLQMVVLPASPSAELAAKNEQFAVVNAPQITEKEFLEAAEARYLFTVKVQYQEELEKPEGTRAEEPNGAGV